MSDKFEALLERWRLDYITRETLRGWVALNQAKPGRGITAEEYKEITGESYDSVAALLQSGR